jgi:haloalkane dehalogenase
VTTVSLARAGGIAFREAVPDGWPAGGPVALFLHGYPTSSYLWRNVLPAASAAGYRAIAPDLPGFGDSPPDRPGTWERQIDAVERFRTELGLDRLVLGVHDWGGLIGLRWACDHAGAIEALVITDTGFFSDGRWHGMAKTMRTEGEGEQLVENINRELLGAAMAQLSPGMGEDAVSEYWKAFADPDRRASHLELYRSGDFAKIAPYEGRLDALGVPTLIVWGARDEFAPVGGAHRFHKRIEGSRLVVLEEAGHYVMEDDPGRVADEIGRFLEEVRR